MAMREPMTAVVTISLVTAMATAMTVVGEMDDALMV